MAVLKISRAIDTCHIYNYDTFRSTEILAAIPISCVKDYQSDVLFEIYKSQNVKNILKCIKTLSAAFLQPYICSKKLCSTIPEYLGLFC